MDGTVIFVDLFIGDGCCSIVLFLWGLSTTIFDCLLQQIWPGSVERGAMTATRLQFALALVIIARKSTIIYVFFCYLCVLVLP